MHRLPPLPPVTIEAAVAHLAVEYRLSFRERQMARGILRGQSNRSIAQELELSTSTVKKHVSNLLRKLGVNSRHEVAALIFCHEESRHD